MSAGIGAPDSPDADAGLRRQQRASAILIGAAAHDIRTPLNTMAGWLQVLQAGQDLPAATRERAFKGLMSAVAQQAALADGLSQMAAINADETALEIGNTDMGQALAAALKTLEAEAGAKQVELDCADAGQPVILVSDGAMAAALLRHCLAGALKFAAKNSRLSVACSAQQEGPPGGCEVRVDLEKSLLPAPGIAAILQYTRGADEAKPGGAGAAFAFAVAQGIAQFLGGSMRVEVGGEAIGAAGVRFILRLPSRA
ncbi:MAG: Chemotaxis protein methyltransferase CheR [Betaproteobacteria bacterium]|nr:Chemotaxis protein methyltransferase CheR [Betaproteobacteria bacterium]